MDANDQPLHEQLFDQIRGDILESMPPNSQLASERELAIRYGVSRNTVRIALAKLERMGLIYRHRGQGTFVSADANHPTDLSETYSFTKQMIQEGKKPFSKVLYLKTLDASDRISKHMGLPLRTPIYELKRLRSADNIPMMIERTFMPADRFPGIDSKSIESNGLYDTMLRKYDAPILHVSEAFSASLMPDQDAALLQVPTGSPSLNIQRTSKSLNGEVVEFTLSLTRADQFIYHAEHRVQNGTTN